MTPETTRWAEIPPPFAQLLEAAWNDLPPVSRAWGNPTAAQEMLAGLTRAVTTVSDLTVRLSDAPVEARPGLAVALAELRHAVLTLQGEVSFASGFLARCSGQHTGGYSREGWKSAGGAHRMTVEG